MRVKVSWRQNPQLHLCHHLSFGFSIPADPCPAHRVAGQPHVACYVDFPGSLFLFLVMVFSKNLIGFIADSPGGDSPGGDSPGADSPGG